MPEENQQNNESPFSTSIPSSVETEKERSILPSILGFIVKGLFVGVFFCGLIAIGIIFALFAVCGGMFM
jgi:hypothetical protein